MRKLFTLLALTLYLLPITQSRAQGWPENYDGVMLQGFSWDDYANARWTVMESQADELSQYFSLVWVPQSGKCNDDIGVSMGYNVKYYFDQNSTFGSEAELRSMIKTFKEKGIGTIADVVVNHRNTDGWFTFPKETYNGVTYQMLPSDICANDDGGNTAAEAKRQGVSLSKNNDTGEDWNGFRDLDHASDNVQKCVKAYVEYLINDLGYTGFRYDMVKGFDAKYVGMYNATAKPEFSVGEYWDGNANVLKKWIDGTKQDGEIQSGAFDFAFRYTVRDAFRDSNLKALGNSSLAKDKSYRRYGVTFVENHDTQYRSASDPQDPIKGEENIPAANAFLLAMPGTPCVFQPHWLKYKSEIKQMILARKTAGITNTSNSIVYGSSNTRFIVGCEDLLCIIGENDQVKADDLGFTLIQEGNRYFYYLRNSLDIPWVNVPSGEYVNSVAVRLTAVTDDPAVKLVYTLDGTEPTKTSATIASGSEIMLTESTTLKVGLLMPDGEVRNVQTRQYTIVYFEPYDATVYVKADFTPVYFYIWDSNNNSKLNGNWPGKRVDNNEANKVQIDGETWLKQTINIGTYGYYFNIIFNQGNNKPQTEDITGINTDRYFIAHLESSSPKGVSYVDVTDQYSSSINSVINDNCSNGAIYTLDGRQIAKDNKSSDVFNNLPRGIYVIDGKKVIK